MTTEIYIVCATVGEYSDRREWIVAAHTSEALAQEHVRLATEASNRFDALSEGKKDALVGKSYEGFRDYDQGFEIDYTGAPRYWLEKTSLHIASVNPHIAKEG